MAFTRVVSGQRVASDHINDLQEAVEDVQSVVSQIDGDDLTTEQVQDLIEGTSLSDLLPPTSGLSMANNTIANVMDPITAQDVATKNYTDLASTSAKARENHTGTQLSNTISDFQESVEDVVGSQIVAGSNIAVNYDDGTGKITLSSTASSTVNALDDLTDVTIITPGQGQFLRRGPTQFTNASIQATDLPTSIDATKIANGNVSNTEFQYLDGVTSSIQTQLNTKQASDSDLTAIAALVPTDNDIIQRKSGAWTNRTPTQLKTDLALNNIPNIDATLRSNHTGTQAASTISDFSSAVYNQLEYYDVQMGGSGDLYQALAYSSNITPNITLGNIIEIGALTSTITINNPTGFSAGQSVVFILRQDAIGGRVVTFGSSYYGVPTLVTSPNLVHVISFRCNSSKLYLSSITTIEDDVAVTTQYATLPMENADDSANYAALVAAGASTYVLSVKWADTEATKGTYSFSSLQTKLTNIRNAGLQVVLGLHAHYPPAWVFTDSETSAGAHWTNQLGSTRQTVSGGVITTGFDQSANFVFSEAIRTRINTWVAQVAANFTGPFVAIRPPACVYGEWSYPHTKDGNDYWAYGTFAQATSTTTGRVSTSRIPYCPVPGWTPGTGTTTQAGQFADWYQDALVDAMRWSCETVTNNFPGTTPIVMLHPSFGTRGTQYADAKASRLDGTSTQAAEVRAGVVWERTIPAIMSNPGTGVTGSRVIHGSTWADCPYSGTGGGYNADNDPYSYITNLLAQQGATRFYAETTGNGNYSALVRTFERFRRRRPWLAMIAFTSNFFNASYASIDNLKHMIQLDTAYSTSVVDAAILYHQGNIKKAQQKADQWGVRTLIGEHGVANDGTWNNLFDHTYKLFDDHNDDVAAWAAFMDQNNNLSIYDGDSAGFKINHTEATAAIYEAHPQPTGGSPAYRRMINVSGAEGGFDRSSTTANSMSNFNPGTYGTDYVYPSLSDLTYLYNRGVRGIRLPFRAERLFTDQTGTTFRTAEQTRLASVIDNCTTVGLKVMLDMHNYARFRYAPDATTAVAIRLLGDTWTHAEHNAMWVAISNWLAATPARNTTVISYSHNEPYNMGSTPGGFTGTTRYDWNDGTVQGWTGDNATATNVSNKLRLSRTVSAAGFFAARKDDAGTMRGGVVSGNIFQVVMTLNPAGTMTSGTTGWAAHVEWQTQGFSWQQATTTYIRQDTSASVSGLISGVPVLVTCDFTNNPVTNPRAFAIQVDNSNATTGTVVVDVDDLKQGSQGTGVDKHEAAFASWVTAVRAADTTRWLWVPAKEYCSLSGFSTNHTGSSKFWTDTANLSGIELHSYYDKYSGGSNDYSGTYSGTYVNTRDLTGQYQ